MKNTRQFVIQQHTTPEGVHWDLMLEMNGCLWTWRLNVCPAEIGDKPIPAERIADHDLRFLTYEGPVQNNTGSVTIIDKGTFTMLEKTSHSLIADFNGKILIGQFSLSQADENKWILEKV